MLTFRRVTLFDRIVVALLVWALVLVGSPWGKVINTAHAAKGGKVYVLGFEKLKGEKIKKKQKGMLSAIQEQLNMAFDDIDGVTVVSAADLKAALAPKPVEGEDIEPSTGTKGAKKDLKKAKKYVNDGLDAIDEEEYEDAMDAFAKAEAAYLKAPNKVGKKTFKRIIKMYVGWAQAAYEEDADDAGKDALSKLLVVAPEYELDEDGDYSRSMLKAFKRLKKKGGKGSLQITAYPKDAATITINGEEQGKGSARLKKIHKGMYFVKITADGYETYTEAVKVDGKEKLKIRLPGGKTEKAEDYTENLASIEKNYEKGKLDEDFIKDLGLVCKAGGVDYVAFGLFYKISKTRLGFQGFLYNHSKETIAKLRTLKVKNMEQAVDKTEKVVRQYKKFIKKFPKKDKYIWSPGEFEGVAKDEEEDEEEAPAPVAVAAPDYDDEEEEAVEPVEEEPVREEVAEEEEEELPVVEKIDLDTDVSFLLDESDTAKRDADMSEKSEKDLSEQDYVPFYSTWWFWTIVGVVVAGGGITAGVLLAPESADNTSTVKLMNAQ